MTVCAFPDRKFWRDSRLSSSVCRLCTHSTPLKDHTLGLVLPLLVLSFLDRAAPRNLCSCRAWCGRLANTTTLVFCRADLSASRSPERNRDTSAFRSSPVVSRTRCRNSPAAGAAGLGAAARVPSVETCRFFLTGPVLLMREPDDSAASLAARLCHLRLRADLGMGRTSPGPRAAEGFFDFLFFIFYFLFLILIF